MCTSANYNVHIGTFVGIPMTCFAKEFDHLLVVLWESGGEERTAGGESYRDSSAEVSRAIDWVSLLGLRARPSD